MPTTCPHCRSHWVILSALQSVTERLFAALGRQAFRCKSCTARFFQFTSRRQRRAIVEARARRIAGYAMVSRVMQHT
jgi:transposase-like protein